MSMINMFLNIFYQFHLYCYTFAIILYTNTWRGVPAVGHGGPDERLMRFAMVALNAVKGVAFAGADNFHLPYLLKYFKRCSPHFNPSS